MNLRDYQQRAVDSIRASIMAGHKRPLLVAPTGSGKSVCMGEIIRLATGKGNTVLWLVHRRNLVTQMADTLKNHFCIESGFIMAGEEFVPGMQVYLATQQTYVRRLNLDELSCNRFFVDADIVLIDECTRSVSPSYQKVLRNYHDKIIIGCTATPARTDGRGLGDVYDDLIDVVDTSKLTADGFLSPCRYFAPSSVDTSKIRVKMGDFDKKELAEKVDKPKIVGNIVQNWLQHGEGRKTIVFTVNVKHSVHIAEEFEKYGIRAAHLDARSSDAERDDVFQAMEKGYIKVVTNCQLYVEGLDVPDVACIVLARPTKSLAMYRQMVGRGLRLSDTHKDCLVFDHGGCVEEHGLVTDPVEWTLDGKKKAWSKKKQAKKEKTVKCRSCHEIFQGAKACPICGTEVKSFGKDVTAVDGELKEINGKKRKFTVADKRRYLGMLKYWVKEKGYNRKMVNAKYKAKFGCWPHHSVKTVGYIQPDDAFRRLMTHELIVWREKQKKRLAA